MTIFVLSLPTRAPPSTYHCFNLLSFFHRLSALLPTSRLRPPPTMRSMTQRVMHIRHDGSGADAVQSVEQLPLAWLPSARVPHPDAWRSVQAGLLTSSGQSLGYSRGSNSTISQNGIMQYRVVDKKGWCLKSAHWAVTSQTTSDLQNQRSHIGLPTCYADRQDGMVTVPLRRAVTCPCPVVPAALPSNRRVYVGAESTTMMNLCQPSCHITSSCLTDQLVREKQPFSSDELNIKIKCKRKAMDERTGVGDNSDLTNHTGDYPVSYTHLTLPPKRIV